MIQDSQSNISDIKLSTENSFIYDKGQCFEAFLSTKNGTPISNQNIVFLVNSLNYTILTDNHGIAKLPINLNSGNYLISTSFGNIINNNTIYVRDTFTVFIPENLTNLEIQRTINSSESAITLEFLGKVYDNIALTVNKNINLVSNSGTILNGIKSKPVISILGPAVNKVQVFGLNIVGGSVGIKITNSVFNTRIINNSISNCDDGIILNGVFSSIIENNSILNIKNNAITLKDSQNIHIINNNLKLNKNGIYYDVGNKNIEIYNNSIAKCSEWAINLDKSGEYSNIKNNSITDNENGILVNCKAEGLIIESNFINKNQATGINFGENYKRNLKGEDAIITNNVVTNNRDMNIVGRESDYKYFNIGGNWVGTDERAYSGVCSKINMPFYTIKTTQIDSSSFEIIIGNDGNIAYNLPSFTIAVSYDGGKTFSLVTISNGKATVHVSNENGNVMIRPTLASGSMVDVILQDYIPYVPSEEPIQPSIPSNPNLPSSNTTQNSESIGSEDFNMGVGGVEVIGIMDGTVSQTTKSDSKISQDSKISEVDSLESTESQSVSKSIAVDEEIVRIAGIGVIILLILIVIFGYYRKDIESMFDNKKGN